MTTTTIPARDLADVRWLAREAMTGWAASPPQRENGQPDVGRLFGLVEAVGATGLELDDPPAADGRLPWPAALTGERALALVEAGEELAACCAEMRAEADDRERADALTGLLARIERALALLEARCGWQAGSAPV
jgi:hypothetical protein